MSESGHRTKPLAVGRCGRGDQLSQRDSAPTPCLIPRGSPLRTDGYMMDVFATLNPLKLQRRRRRARFTLTSGPDSRDAGAVTFLVASTSRRRSCCVVRVGPGPPLIMRVHPPPVCVRTCRADEAPLHETANFSWNAP
jgi:hypothetical protein